MDLKEQYLNEINQSKQERINRIIKIAKKEFAANGIANTKLSTIAREAEVGEASLYRYFTDKIQLIKLVATDYWIEQINVFNEYMEDNIDARMSGLMKMKAYLEMFLELYYYQKDFLKFMEDFDNLDIQQNINNEENEFIRFTNDFKKVYLEFFNEGIQDGSIDSSKDAATYYSFVSQVMVSTTQKTALRLGYYRIQDDNYAIDCLNNTIDMFIQYISNIKAK